MTSIDEVGPRAKICIASQNTTTRWDQVVKCDPGGMETFVIQSRTHAGMKMVGVDIKILIALNLGSSGVCFFFPQGLNEKREGKVRLLTNHFLPSINGGF